MKKVKKQNIDRLIHGIETILKNRCSLLDEEVNLLNEVISLLKKVKQTRKKADNDDLELLIKIVTLLSQVFLFSDQFTHVIGNQTV